MVQEKEFDVVGIGACCVDQLAVVPSYPPLDTRVKIESFTKQGGGPVATALVTLARLGARVSFIGKMGNDENAQFMLEEFKREGVDTKGVVFQKDSSSPFAFVTIEKSSGKRTIFWTRFNLQPITADELNKELITSAKMLFLDEYEPEAALLAARWAQNRKVKVALDANDLQPHIEELIKFSDYFITSQEFSEKFSGIDNPAKAAEKMSKLGPSLVVITLGERGSFCWFEGKIIVKPAFRVKVVDTTGAGDVFHGAFLFGLLQNWDMEKIMIFSNAVAALKCTKLGGRAGIPFLGEALDFIKRYKWTARF